MTVKLLMITHEQVGSVLIQAARLAFGELPLKVDIISVQKNSDLTLIQQQLNTILATLSIDHYLLILTDLFGSTPSNIAESLVHDPRVHIISGVNLPMIVRIMNYSHLAIDELINKAVTGGKEGIVASRAHGRNNS